FPVYSQLINDIALVYLKKSIEYNDHIRPICLPIGMEGVTFAGYNAKVAGWGNTRSGMFCATFLSIMNTVLKSKIIGDYGALGQKYLTFYANGPILRTYFPAVFSLRYCCF